MQASRDMVPIAPLLATIVAIAGLTSAVWWGVWQRHDHRQSAATAALEQELAHVRADRQQLASRLDATRESRHEQALELQRLGDQLQTTRRQLKAIEAENWPARHTELKQRNYELSEQVAELEVRNSITRDNYAADFERLQDKHEQLQQDFSALKASREALRDQADDTDKRITQLQQQLAKVRSFAAAEITALQAGLKTAKANQDTLVQWRRTLEHDLISSEIQTGKLAERITALADERRRLQTRLAASEEQLQTLQARNKQLTASLKQTDNDQPAVKPIEQQPRARAVAARTTAQEKEDNSDAGFRLARLESLKSALANSNTADRRTILLTVLPTIPGGIRGTELAPLLDGMRATDIIAIIRDSRAHIRRPVDNDGYERIMRHLADEKSRRTVTRLLQ